jgi:hypothetical protein
MKLDPAGLPGSAINAASRVRDRITTVTITARRGRRRVAVVVLPDEKAESRKLKMSVLAVSIAFRNTDPQ